MTAPDTSPTRGSYTVHSGPHLATRMSDGTRRLRSSSSLLGWACCACAIFWMSASSAIMVTQHANDVDGLAVYTGWSSKSSASIERGDHIPRTDYIQRDTIPGNIPAHERPYTHGYILKEFAGIIIGKGQHSAAVLLAASCTRGAARRSCWIMQLRSRQPAIHMPFM